MKASLREGLEKNVEFSTKGGEGSARPDFPPKMIKKNKNKKTFDMA